MDELRVVRREDESLIVATEAGEEYRLVVDSSVLAELRHLAKHTHSGSRVNPRKIQSLIRAGKTREEIMQITGADEGSIERYEEPVLAERRFILEAAQRVAVRAKPGSQDEERFGVVIAERLISVNATDVVWTSWRDEEAGWMVGLDFTAQEVVRHAVWSFEHRKGVLTPLTPDAVHLSRPGDFEDRLIPKLRAVSAVDSEARFDSDAFVREQLFDGEAEPQPELHDDDPQLTPAPPEAVPQTAPEQPGVEPQRGTEEQPAPSSLTDPFHDAAAEAAAEAASRARHPSTGAIPVLSPEDEFARRRNIEQRAINTPELEQPNLGQTADLLDALRRRRSERAGSADATGNADEADRQPVPLHETEPHPLASDQSKPPVLLPTPTGRNGHDPDAQQPQADRPAPAGPQPADSSNPQHTSKRGKGRAPIPSWDDILFGTRSEEDPS